MDKDDLITKIKNGDKEAFSELFRIHYPRIFSFLYHLLNDRDMAEEISQDVFFRLWVNHASLNSELSIDAYLFSIARHTAASFYKKTNLEQQYIHSLDDDPGSDADENINYKELRRIITNAIKEMPRQQQLVFRMSREQELLNTEIAEKLNISKRTVEKHISNSLKTLRLVIARNYNLFF